MGAGYLLLVEDDPDHAALILRALHRAGVEQETVWMPDGDQALAYLFCRADSKRSPTHLPVLILLDLKLPRLSGLEVLARIRQHPVTQWLPVVILSSSDEEGDVDEAYRLGANSYVIKPVDSLQFETVMGRLTRYWLGVNKGPNTR